MEQLRFSVPEILSLIGVVQCVYILVYILFRVANFKQSVLPVLYFFVLGCAFFIDFSREYIGGATPFYDIFAWMPWAFGVPLSALLIIQIAQMSKLPAWPCWLVLLLVPTAFLFSLMMKNLDVACAERGSSLCPALLEWLNITGSLAGALSLLMVWVRRSLLEGLHSEKIGKERYWLILALVIVDVIFLILMLMADVLKITPVDSALARTVVGLCFIYLVTTSLFRIYPQALALIPDRKKSDTLSLEDEKIIEKIKNLLTLDKVYHEPTYSRADLARELSVSEATVSRIINIYYNKSLPQLLNEQRVEDAKRLLLDKKINIKIIAQEVGFNSIPSFNRVFKELEGRSPSDYRKNMIR